MEQTPQPLDFRARVQELLPQIPALSPTPAGRNYRVPGQAEWAAASEQITRRGQDKGSFVEAVA